MLSNCTVRLIAAMLLASPLAIAAEGTAQDDKKIPPDVRHYLTFTLGRWESTTSYFDGDGKITKKEVEGFGEEVLIRDHLNLHSSYNADGTVNKAFRFYSPEDDRFYLIDVTRRGTWWVLSGARGEDVMYSQEKELADGRKVILRITHSNLRDDAFDAVAEVSFDGGKAWRKMSRQSYRKIGEDPNP